MSTMVAVLQHGWYDAIATIAPDVDGIESYLSDGLAYLSEHNLVDEAHLLKLVEGVGDAAPGAPYDVIRELTRRLSRTIYEYLLALDTLNTELGSSQPQTEWQPSRRSGGSSGDAMLIGADEIDEISHITFDQPKDEPEPLEPFLAALGVSADDVEEEPEVAVAPHDSFTTAGTSIDESLAAPPAPPAATEAPAAAPEEAAAKSAVEHDVSVVPREGFHIPDAAPAETAAEAPAEAEPEVAYEPEPVRVPAHHADFGVNLDTVAETIPGRFDLSGERSKIDDKLRKKRFDDVVAIVQQLAQSVGGRNVAELAIDAGDRCRPLRHRQAATACYLSASSADPAFDLPWLRLADVCMEDSDIGLAVSYLERAGRLASFRGDRKAEMDIYRRIAELAPHRVDILELLVRSEAAGFAD